MKKRLRSKRGYTLVELMVVVAIMAILAAASTPIFTGYIKKARASEYLAECRAVYMAAQTYLIEHQQTFGGSEADFENLEAEIGVLSGVEVEVLGRTRGVPATEYGIVLVERDAGNWECGSVICRKNDEIWVFDAERGSLEEMKE